MLQCTMTEQQIVRSDGVVNLCCLTGILGVQFARTALQDHLDAVMQKQSVLDSSFFFFISSSSAAVKMSATVTVSIVSQQLDTPARN